MSGITVTQLKYLKAVVDCGGFSKAADRINVSQSALTRQIQALEEECGVPLLIRGARGVIVTDEGQAMLDAAETVFNSLGYTENLARSFARKTLRVRSVSTPKMAEYVRLCRDKLRSAEIDVAIGTYSEVLGALSRHECDVGFLTMPENESGFEAIEVDRHPYYAYVPKTHPWAQRNSISIKELQGQEIIVSPPFRRSRQVFDEFLRRSDVEVRVSREVSSVETVWHLAQEGVGIGILVYNGTVGGENLVRLPFSEDMTIPLHFVALPKEKRSPLVNAAVALGRELRTSRLLAGGARIAGSAHTKFYPPPSEQVFR